MDMEDNDKSSAEMVDRKVSLIMNDLLFSFVGITCYGEASAIMLDRIRDRLRNKGLLYCNNKLAIENELVLLRDKAKASKSFVVLTDLINSRILKLEKDLEELCRS